MLLECQAGLQGSLNSAIDHLMTAHADLSPFLATVLLLLHEVGKVCVLCTVKAYREHRSQVLPTCCRVSLHHSTHILKISPNSMIASYAGQRVN